MCNIELCNKRDRSPGSFRRQIRLKNVEFGSRFHRRQRECDKNSQIFKFKRIHLVYHIIDFLRGPIRPMQVSIRTKFIFAAVKYQRLRGASMAITKTLYRTALG